MQKGQKIEDKAGARNDGHPDGDAQQPHYFFTLLFSSFTLLLFFFSCLFLCQYHAVFIVITVDGV
jgi:hypothetical protein